MSESESLPFLLRPYADLTDCDGDESVVALVAANRFVTEAYRLENGYGDPCGVLLRDGDRGWWFAYDSLRRTCQTNYPTKAAALVALDEAILVLAFR